MDKNKPSPRVSTRSALKKQADDFMTEFGGDLAMLNEKLKVFSRSMFEFLQNCVKTQSHTTSTAQEITELRKK